MIELDTFIFTRLCKKSFKVVATIILSDFSRFLSSLNLSEQLYIWASNRFMHVVHYAQTVSQKKLFNFDFQGDLASKTVMCHD